MNELTSSLILALFALLLIGSVVGYRANQVDWGHTWLNLIDGIFRVYIRHYHRFVYDAIPLPAQGPALLASNHVSGLDPFLMMAACRRPVRFLIAREQYERFGLRWLFRAAGCIPVERNGRAEVAFRAALAALEAGEVVGLFPGGGFHHDPAQPVRLKRGVARLAELSGASVYPVYVSGIKGIGHTLLAMILPSRASLKGYALLDCQAFTEKKCLEHLSEILNKNSEMTT